MKKNKYIKNEDFEDKAKKIVDKNCLSKNKVHPIFLLANKINEENTVVAVNGKQGSGKTEVIDAALHGIFLPKKGFFNFLGLLLLYTLRIIIILFFSTIAVPLIVHWINLRFHKYGSLGPINEWMDKNKRRISRRRWKKINLNIWKIFGNREVNEYKGINTTAFLLLKKMSCDNDSVFRYSEEIRSFLAGNAINYEEFNKLNNNEFKDRLSWIFFTKAIWKTIFSKFKKNNPFSNKLKGMLYNDTFVEEEGSIKLRYIFFEIISFMLLFIISSAITWTLSILIWHLATGDDVSKILLKSFGTTAPVSGIISTIAKVYISRKIKNKKIKRDNEFFVNPVSNVGIEKYVKKLCKNRFVIMHVNEIDRFKSWLETNLLKEDNSNNQYTKKENMEIQSEIDSIISKIIEIISLGFAESNNMNILFETTPDVISSVRRLSGVEGDRPAKVFNETIYVKTIGVRDILDYKSDSGLCIDETRCNFNLLEHLINFQNIVQIDYQIMHFNSWRHIKELITIYNSAVKKIPYYFFEVDEFGKQVHNLNEWFWKYLFADEFRKIFGIQYSVDTKETWWIDNEKFSMKIPERFEVQSREYINYWNDDSSIIDFIRYISVEYFPYVDWLGVTHKYLSGIEVANPMERSRKIFENIMRNDIPEKLFFPWDMVLGHELNNLQLDNIIAQKSGFIEKIIEIHLPNFKKENRNNFLIHIFNKINLENKLLFLSTINYANNVSLIKELLKIIKEDINPNFGIYGLIKDHSTDNIDFLNLTSNLSKVGALNGWRLIQIIVKSKLSLCELIEVIGKSNSKILPFSHEFSEQAYEEYAELNDSDKNKVRKVIKFNKTKISKEIFKKRMKASFNNCKNEVIKKAIMKSK